MMKTCRGANCGAQVEFLENALTGRKVIVDAVPVKGWLEAAPGRVTRGLLYIDHHATCPDVKQFRKAAAPIEPEPRP